MNDLDIPIFKKTYDLYKEFSLLRTTVPKKDRYTIWQSCEEYILEMMECILTASQLQKDMKLPVLEKASLKLNMTRVFMRLMKDTKALDSKHYIAFQASLDEIGRMLGGWIRSTKA
jgi:hypothetical protein